MEYFINPATLIIGGLVIIFVTIGLLKKSKKREMVQEPVANSHTNHHDYVPESGPPIPPVSEPLMPVPPPAIVPDPPSAVAPAKEIEDLAPEPTSPIEKPNKPIKKNKKKHHRHDHL